MFCADLFNRSKRGRKLPPTQTLILAGQASTWCMKVNESTKVHRNHLVMTGGAPRITADNLTLHNLEGEDTHEQPTALAQAGVEAATVSRAHTTILAIRNQNSRSSSGECGETKNDRRNYGDNIRALADHDLPTIQSLSAAELVTYSCYLRSLGSSLRSSLNATTLRITGLFSDLRGLLSNAIRRRCDCQWVRA